MGALVPIFERTSGNKVAIKFQGAPQTIAQLKEGAGIDLLIGDDEMIDGLVKDGGIAAGGSSRAIADRRIRIPRPRQLQTRCRLKITCPLAVTTRSRTMGH